MDIDILLLHVAQRTTKKITFLFIILCESASVLMVIIREDKTNCETSSVAKTNWQVCEFIWMLTGCSVIHPVPLKVIPTASSTTVVVVVVH